MEEGIEVQVPDVTGRWESACARKEGRRQLEGGKMGEVPKVSRRSGE